MSVLRLDAFYLLVAFTDEVSTLSNTDQSLTVFGPIDEAAEDPEIRRLTLLNYRKLHLPSFVETHIVESSLTTFQLLTASNTLTMKSGQVFIVNSDNSGNVVLTDTSGTTMATVTTPDVQADNGYMHVIDSFLAPSWFWSTVIDLVEGQFSDFMNLVAKTPSIEQHLRNMGNTITLLAPTDAAIRALPDGVWDRIQEDTAYAEALVSAHFIRNIYTIHDLRGTTQLLTGNTFPYYLWNMVPLGTDGVAINNIPVVTPNILAYNGVTHAIDGVFLPGGGPPTLSPTVLPTLTPTTQTPTAFPVTTPPTIYPTLSPSRYDSVPPTNVKLKNLPTISPSKPFTSHPLRSPSLVSTSSFLSESPSTDSRLNHNKHVSVEHTVLNAN